jgi:hypothetical protein
VKGVEFAVAEDARLWARPVADDKWMLFDNGTDDAHVPDDLVALALSELHRDVHLTRPPSPLS